MKRSIILLTLGTLICFGCQTEPASTRYVAADLYYRYQAIEKTYTAEAKLSLRDSTTGLDSAYLVETGIAFMGSNLPSDLRNEKWVRYRTELSSTQPGDVRFTFPNAEGEQVSIPGTLRPFDSLIMGPSPTHNFGFTVYSTDKNDMLGENETLSVLFEPDDSDARLGTLLGPTTQGGEFRFARETVADWPLSTGTLTFIRRRTTPIDEQGVKGQLTEEVYSKAIRDAMVN